MLFAIGLLMSISVLGTIGFMLIEGYELLQAIYMTVITMSTVGYGWDEIPSQGGKVFSVFLIIISAGTFLYAISTITSFILEGEIRNIFNRYQVNKKVARMKNHIIICGLGRNGREAARELIRQGRNFLVIESNEQVVEEFVKEIGEILVVRGDATHEEILDQANIKEAEGLVSTLSTDAENVYITLTAREMNPKLKIVARASHEYSISKLKRAGANQVIVPNLIGGKKMADMLTRPALVEFVDLISGASNPNLHLEEFMCDGHSKLLGKTLAELKIRSKSGVLVLGMKRGGDPIELNPQAKARIRQGDRLFVLGTDEQLETFRSIFLD